MNNRSHYNFKNIVVVGIMHVLAVIALLPAFWNLNSLICLAFLYFLTGCCGISIGYHRYITHKSFECNKWLEYFLVTCGALAMQIGPTKWSYIHNIHHKYCDTDKDPHTPINNFWWGYIGWLTIRDDYPKLKSKNWYYRFLDNYYPLLQIPLAILLFSIGGISMVLWGIALRICLVWHVSWINNSVAHTVGTKRYLTNDNSRNNLIVALLTFGEGWHNNHHRFPNSARIGMSYWQIDIGWIVIQLLSKIGLVSKINTRDINTNKSTRYVHKY